MSRQWVRLGCLIIMLAVAIPSGYRLLHSEQHNDASQEAAAAFEDLTWTLSLAVAKLEAAQRAYVAGGQDGERWYAVVDRQLETVVGGLKELSTMARSAHALDSIAAAEITVDHLRGIDGIAREHAVSGETLMASDVVFADARELALRATTELAAARSAEQAALADFEKQRLQTQIATWSIATAVSTAIVLLLVPVVTRARAQDPLTVTTTDGSDDELNPAADIAVMAAPHALEFDIEPLDPGDEPSPALLAAEEGRTEPPPAVAAPTAPELSELARVCTELGCVSEETELQDALGRVSALLNASALAVWIGDARGDELRPVAGHGFAADVLRRLGTLSSDDDNITAAAYRTHEVQVASALGDHLGAIAAPLITTSARGVACKGVLSVEIRDGWETRTAVQSTAAILAAQLGTLIGASSAARHGRADLPSHAARLA